MKKGLLILLSLLLFGSYHFTTMAQGKFTVVIDAGHGGKDPGALRGTYKEKEINLAVVLALGKLIENNYKDVKVIYTRKKDVFIELSERAAIANRNKANLFISIHTNSTDAKVSSAAGADTYMLGLTKSDENLAVAKRENSVVTFEKDYKSKYEGFDPRSPESFIIYEFMSNKYMEQSYQFASAVQDGFRTVAKRKDRGVRQAGFLVLWRTAMPSVLIELGFVNNPSEGKYLTSSAGQNAMARSIYTGFKKYKTNFDKMQGNTQAYTPNPKDEFDLVDDPVDDRDSSVVASVEPPAKTNSEQPIVVSVGTNHRSDSRNEIEYRVQFLISQRRLPINSKLFKNLSPVEFYIEDSIHKYTCGSTTDENEILKIQKQVRTKFKDAFVVKIKDGKRIK